MELNLSRSRWKCDACGAEAIIEHATKAGIDHVVTLVRASHAAVSLRCKFDPATKAKRDRRSIHVTLLGGL